MPKVKDIEDKIIIDARNIEVNLSEFYKLFKKTADDYDYQYFEKKHQNKVSKYGREILWEITLSKQFDSFAKAEFSLSLTLTAFKASKSGERGNVKLVMDSKLHYDLEDRYEKGFLQKFFFMVFFKFGGEDRLDKYKIPAEEFKNELLKRLRDQCGLYHSQKL